MPDIDTTCPGCGTDGPEGYCETCAERKWRKTQTTRRTEEAKSRFSTAISQGLVTEALRTARFSQNNPDIEGLNLDAWAFARGWDRQNLFIFGDIGIGKSHLCRCILRKWFIAGRSVAECSTLSYLTKARIFGAEQWVANIKKASILLFDDIDKNNFRGDSVPHLWDLFEHRASRKLPTLITSNIDTAALMAQMKTNSPENSSIAIAALDRLKPITKLEMRGRSQR